jgi:hypothetical protein
MTSWPGYPPPVPPRPPTPWYRSLWFWLSVYGTVVVAAGVAVFIVFVNGITAPFDDAYDPTYGNEYWVEQGSVNRAVEDPCDEMATAAGQIQIFSTPSVGAASLHHFVEVGRGIPTAIDSVDDADGQALRWRNDWIAVLDAVDAYADKLEADGEGTFDTPVNGDGDPVIANMSDVSDTWCEVPPLIAALDPNFQLY